MKIIQIDNFNRDSVSDVLIAENVNKYFCPIIVNLLNVKFSGTESPNFYKSVEDDHKLYEFEP